ncbi:MAG: flavodoxin domain-containing protein [archaeon]|nr:flavodoxin domain-containing protein [archaeon]
MTDTVIIYTSFAGKTRRIAKYIAEKLDADIFDLKQQTNICLDSYSKVILGTGVHAGSPYGRLTKFIEANEDILLGKQVHLFISCIYSGEKGEKQTNGIANEYNIHNAVFFPGKGEKNEAGLNTDVDLFIERMRS